MKKNINFPWLFWLELSPLLFVPVVIWWSTTPTNVLNASAAGKLLELAGILGLQAISFSVLPLGITGLLLAKKQTKLRIATIVLSILNLSLGILIVLGILWIMYLLAFKGLSV